MIYPFDLALRHHAAAQPGDVFCWFESRSHPLTFGELAALADRIHGRLLMPQVKRQRRIGILMPNGPVLLATIVAASAAGALAAPLDVTLPVRALQFQLGILKPDLIACSDTLSMDKAVAAGYASITSLFHERSLQGRVEVMESDNAPADDLPQFAIFTSGTTGKIKAAVLTRKNVRAGIDNLVEGHAFTNHDVGICLLPLSHANGLLTTFIMPLVTGGKVVYLNDVPLTPKTFCSVIERYRVTWFSAVPTHFRILVQSGDLDRSGNVATCRFGRSASAPLPPVLQKQFERMYSIPVVQTMGLTETAGPVFCQPMPPFPSVPGMVGRPIGTHVQIVDEARRAVPAGTAGEIRVRGDNVMAGYLDDPEETRRVLDDGWLYTGDLAVQDQNGFYGVVGRKKEIAIFNGVNISLSRMEQVAQEFSGIDEAAAVSRPHDLFGEAVRVFYTARADSVDEAALRSFLIQHLPHPLALDGVARRDGLPRTSSGKIVRAMLK